MILSKTKNTVRGSFFGVLNKVFGLVFPFITRTCIIHVLGNDYAGLSGLFTSILSVLSLAELGFGSAIVFSMYKPIAEDDREKVCALLNLYKKIYFVVGSIVLGVGLALLPFLRAIIKDQAIPGALNIYALYGMYLANSVFSYWIFAYKSSLLAAFQRNDLISNTQTLLNLLMYSWQIVSILVFKNYYSFVAVIPVTTLLINVVISFIASKKFPQFQPSGRISEDDKAAIRKQMIGLLCERLALTSRNAFDSIFISAFIGLTAVGIYNNYFYILNALTAILGVIFESMRAGIGNSIAIHPQEKNHKDFLMVNFMYMFIAGLCTVMLVSLFQPFMVIWVGDQALLPLQVVFLLGLYFFEMKATDTVWLYIGASGLWWKCKFFYIIEAVLNVGLNALLGYFFGVTGIVIATIIAILFNILACSALLYKTYFVTFKVRQYWLRNLLYLFVTSLGVLLGFFATFYVSFHSESLLIQILEFVVKAIIAFSIGLTLFVLLFFKYDQWRLSAAWLKTKFSSLKRRHNNEPASK